MRTVLRCAPLAGAADSVGWDQSAGYTYLANSPRASQSAFTNSGALRMMTTKQYDHLNRLTSIGGTHGSTTLDSHAYSYNTANQRTSVKTFLISVALMLLSGCSKDIHGGNPALPLSTTNGTTCIFPAPESIILVAISNAFPTSDDNPMGYRGMMLSPASSYSSNRGLTNGLELFPIIGPIANVPLRGPPPKTVPYSACFNIMSKAVDGTHTSVTVRTVFANVIDGEEPGVHGGWANHERDVSPVKGEEENVLNAISNALVALPVEGRPNR